MKAALIAIALAPLPLFGCLIDGQCEFCSDPPRNTAPARASTDEPGIVAVRADAGLPQSRPDGLLGRKPFDAGGADAGRAADGGRADAVPDTMPEKPISAPDGAPPELVTDAGAGVICDVGGCGVPMVPLCLWNHECGPAGRCADGACQRSCTSDGACGTGDTCQAGFCQPSVASGGQCLYARDCGLRGTCINGFCHGACSADPDCVRAADRCSAGLCQPDRRPTPQCSSSAQCLADRLCVNAVCRTPCLDDGNCGPNCSGTICAQGICVEPQELSPVCRRNHECGAGALCVDALCR